MKHIPNDYFIYHFFNRIKIETRLKPDLLNLRKIIAAHVQHIPFEYNWHSLSKSKNIDLASLFNNIILQKLGGYCYETGILFNHLLQTIGFNTQLISGQIYRKEILDHNSLHLAILVQLEHQHWLVDVSWNGGIAAPIVLNTGIQVINNMYYRIKQVGHGIELWEKKENWKKNYYVVALGDPLKMATQKHLFHQFDNRSEFYKKKILLYSK